MKIMLVGEALNAFVCICLLFPRLRSSAAPWQGNKEAPPGQEVLLQGPGSSSKSETDHHLQPELPARTQDKPRHARSQNKVKTSAFNWCSSRKTSLIVSFSVHQCMGSRVKS